jgi:hypothetical protein
MPLPPSLRGLLRTTPSLAPVPHRALISVTGSQAAEFLQGVLSSSVPSPPKPFYSAFLHAQVRHLSHCIEELALTLSFSRDAFSTMYSFIHKQTLRVNLAS